MPLLLADVEHRGSVGRELDLGSKGCCHGVINVLCLFFLLMWSTMAQLAVCWTRGRRVAGSSITARKSQCCVHEQDTLSAA